jgi:hypothetical protein
VTVESRSLVEEINELLAAPPAPERERYLAHLEHTLATGYARALALEAERWRLERRLGEVASAMAHSEDPAGAKADEIVSLARCMSAATTDLSTLRGVLSTLRDRAASVRAA